MLRERHRIPRKSAEMSNQTGEVSEGFSFHGEMKYHFHRQLLLRFCVLANFSNKRCNCLIAFCKVNKEFCFSYRP